MSRNKTIESRRRTLWKDDEIEILIYHFQKDPKPSTVALTKISESLGREIKVVRNWFSNQRIRAKKSNQVGVPKAVPSPPKMANYIYEASDISNLGPMLVMSNMKPLYSPKLEPQMSNFFPIAPSLPIIEPSLEQTILSNLKSESYSPEVKSKSYPNSNQTQPILQSALLYQPIYRPGYPPCWLNSMMFGSAFEKPIDFSLNYDQLHPEINGTQSHSFQDQTDTADYFTEEKNSLCSDNSNHTIEQATSLYPVNVYKEALLVSQ